MGLHISFQSCIQHTIDVQFQRCLTDITTLSGFEDTLWGYMQAGSPNFELGRWGLGRAVRFVAKSIVITKPDTPVSVSIITWRRKCRLIHISILQSKRKLHTCGGVANHNKYDKKIASQNNRPWVPWSSLGYHGRLVVKHEHLRLIKFHLEGQGQPPPR